MSYKEVRMKQEIKDRRYIAKLEAAVKKIPNIYMEGAMDKDWGYTGDDLDIRQDKYQKKVDKLIRN